MRLNPVLDEGSSQASSLPGPSSMRSQNNSAPLSPGLFELARSPESPSLEGNISSPSMSTSTTASYTPYVQPPDILYQPSNDSRPDWTHLPPDLQFYLEFYYSDIGICHYCIPCGPDEIFRTTMLRIAMQSGHDAFLNAMVGFSAYHYTVRDPNGKVEDFLKYYNQSVTLLLNSFKRREKQNISTLLTILQLATIEVR